MDCVNYVAKLNEYSQKAQISDMKYEEVGTDGPDHLKTFSLRVVVKGLAYPVGVGKTKKEAKQNAAKHAWNGIIEAEQNETPVVGNSPVSTGVQKEDMNQAVVSLSNAVEHLNNSPAPKQRSFISAEETNFIGILNHYCQKTGLFIDFQLVERCGPSHNPQFVYKVVIDKKEYPTGLGKTAKEAKQQAAQHAWSALQEHPDWNSQVSCRSTVSEEEDDDDVSSSLTASISQESQDATSSSCQSMSETGSTSDSIVFTNSSHVCLPKQDERPSNVKTKIKLAANFLMSPVSTKKAGFTVDLSPVHPSGLSCLASAAPLKIVQDNPALKGNNLGTSNRTMSAQLVKSRFLSEFDSIERIGKGGFGCVYKARRKLEQKYYAVKIVKSKEKAKREVGALADLQHPNIVRYYTAWEEETDYRCNNTSDSYSSSCSSSSSSSDFLYIQMELCDKRTLKVWIDEWNSQRTPKRREDSLHITQQIVNGVEYIHSKKLIHRDLKPVNIMFGSGDGGVNEEIKIGDFGLVTAEDDNDDENMLERTKRTGTRSYMAPEQRNKTSYDRKVDIFALGLIYYELLCNVEWRTQMEKSKVWEDVRSQRFSQRFHTQFPLEHKMIESMLCANPEQRPDARQLKVDLMKATDILTTDFRMQQDNMTI
ncbi:hypothetical protein DPEC_G00325610 [Dallia pectoralis]|uniref:Uncharacterized protein n=1 Tax=Dallia pectoralis TaxID=75939 RepID=A0ACC2F7M5_DALPE|nr:hypothetical protein DPEC_G00325610 [Dallia pectoralis]